jgi:hypothetical protein
MKNRAGVDLGKNRGVVNVQRARKFPAALSPVRSGACPSLLTWGFDLYSLQVLLKFSVQVRRVRCDCA